VQCGKETKESDSLILMEENPAMESPIPQKDILQEVELINFKCSMRCKKDPVLVT
jgi:hypothetical protein